MSTLADPAIHFSCCLTVPKILRHKSLSVCVCSLVPQTATPANPAVLSLKQILNTDISRFGGISKFLSITRGFPT